MSSTEGIQNLVKKDLHK